MDAPFILYSVGIKLYRLNTATGQTWKLDFGDTWELVRDSPWEDEAKPLPRMTTASHPWGEGK